MILFGIFHPSSLANLQSFTHMYHHMNNFSHISLQSFQNIASDFPLADCFKTGHVPVKTQKYKTHPVALPRSVQNFKTANRPGNLELCQCKCKCKLSLIFVWCSSPRPSPLFLTDTHPGPKNLQCVHVFATSALCNAHPFKSLQNPSQPPFLPLTDYL